MDKEQMEVVLKAGGAAAVVDAAKPLAAKDRIALLRLAIRTIAFGTWPSSYVDDMIQIGDAAISEALAIAEKNEANIICFNMSSNLCDCWNDAFKRERRHFEAGLAYADRALALRRELGKPADKLAMAHWARGKHLLSLGLFVEAVAALQENLNCLEAVNKDEQEELLAAKAYLGLARQAAGESDGKSQYDRAMTELATLKERDPKKAEDVQLYIDQLLTTESRLWR